MGLVIPEGYASLAFIHREQLTELGTEPFVWTIGARPGSDPEDIVAILDDLGEAWNDNIRSITSNSIALQAIEASIPATGGGTGSLSSTFAAMPGTRDDDPSYVAFAPKVRKQTQMVGRKYKGVLHPPGLLAIDEVTSSGSISLSKIPQITDAFLAFASAAFAITTHPFYLLHTGAEAPTPIFSFQCQPKVGILRDRML